MTTASNAAPSRGRTLAWIALGAALLFTGTAHLTFARETFRAQVPSWFPMDVDLVVLLSGVVELALGLGLLLARARRRQVGWLTAAFFVAIFPGTASCCARPVRPSRSDDPARARSRSGASLASTVRRRFAA